jgi:NADH-quinone oxidoreductase subunit N
MNVGAFAVITQITGYAEHTRSIEDFTGVALRRPWLGGLLAFFLLSMIGIPFTGGFFGKFYVFSAVIGGGHWLLAVVGLLNSGLACFYYLRLLVAMYARHPHEAGNERAQFTKVSPAAMLGLAACALATLLLGVLPGHVLNLANRGAGAILSGPPAASLLPPPTLQDDTRP